MFHPALLAFYPHTLGVLTATRIAVLGFHTNGVAFATVRVRFTWEPKPTVYADMCRFVTNVETPAAVIVSGTFFLVTVTIVGQQQPWLFSETDMILHASI